MKWGNKKNNEHWNFEKGAINDMFHISFFSSLYLYLYLSLSLYFCKECQEEPHKREVLKL